MNSKPASGLVRSWHPAARPQENQNQHRHKATTPIMTIVKKTLVIGVFCVGSNPAFIPSHDTLNTDFWFTLPSLTDSFENFVRVNLGFEMHASRSLRTSRPPLSSWPHFLSAGFVPLRKLYLESLLKHIMSQLPKCTARRKKGSLPWLPIRVRELKPV